MNRPAALSLALLPPTVATIFVIGSVWTKRSGLLAVHSLTPIAVGLVAGIVSLLLFHGWSTLVAREQKIRVVVSIIATQMLALASLDVFDSPLRFVIIAIALGLGIWSVAPRLRRDS